MTARGRTGESTVVGTTLGTEHRPWLVRALGYAVEIELDPRMLVLENEDVPGMIGRVGTILGGANVNIANMNVSRNQSGGNALMVVSVDEEPTAALLTELEATKGVATRPRFIRLDLRHLFEPLRRAPVGWVSSRPRGQGKGAMQESEKIWMNGELVDWHEAKIHVLSHALHYGSGVFEGIRAYATDRGPAVFRLREHLERLRRSGEVYFLELPYSTDELRAAVHETLAANELETCYVRPIVFRGYGEMGINPLNCPVDVVIAVWPWGAYLGEEALEHGVRVGISSWRRIGPNTVPAAAKASGQYLNSQLAKLEAMKSGYDEAILLNEQGYLADGSGENVFVIRDGVLATPPVTASCLPGITRDTVIRIGRELGHDVQERDVVRTDLYHADELFFCGHRRRDHPDPLGRRPRGRHRADHEGHPEGVLRDHLRPPPALRRVPRLPVDGAGAADRARRVVTLGTRSLQLARPDIGAREEEYVLDALHSGVLGLGPYTRRFEEAFAAFHGTRYAAAVSSGTAGLHLAVRIAEIGPGDEVITTPISFVGLGQLGAVRARDAGLRRRRRADLQHRPRRDRGGHHAADEGRDAGAHLRPSGRDRPDQRDRPSGTAWP